MMEKEEEEFMTYTAISGLLRYFGFIFGELSCCPSLYKVYGSNKDMHKQKVVTEITFRSTT